MTAQTWNPEQYNKFRDERLQPALDLIAMLEPQPRMRVVDLGCGTGEITTLLAGALPDSIVTGIDSSPAMLAQAAGRASERVTFRQGDLRDLRDHAGYDVIYSNAVFQWVPNNDLVLPAIFAGMKPGAQIAIQVPKNDEHPSHALAHVVAQEPPFCDLLNGYVRETYALSLERYAGLLYGAGFQAFTCIEKIYPHVLASTDGAIEWVKGSILTAYLSRLDSDGQAAFLAAYRARLLAEVGDQSPFFYPFRRLLFWGRKPE